jgi:hypothetical protein
MDERVVSLFAASLSEEDLQQWIAIARAELARRSVVVETEGA